MRQGLAGLLQAYVKNLQDEGHTRRVVEDGAPVHTSKQVKATCNLGSLPNQFHPSASPDLNPVESVWNALK